MEMQTEACTIPNKPCENCVLLENGSSPLSIRVMNSAYLNKAFVSRNQKDDLFCIRRPDKEIQEFVTYEELSVVLKELSRDKESK